MHMCARAKVFFIGLGIKLHYFAIVSLEFKEKIEIYIDNTAFGDSY